jgi:hypothetical protein
MMTFPSDYKALAVWHASSGADYIAGLQEQALIDGQPLDIVCIDPQDHSKWLRVSNLPASHWFHACLASHGITVTIDREAALVAAVRNVSEVRTLNAAHAREDAAALAKAITECVAAHDAFYATLK